MLLQSVEIGPLGIKPNLFLIEISVKSRLFNDGTAIVPVFKALEGKRSENLRDLPLFSSFSSTSYMVTVNYH